MANSINISTKEGLEALKIKLEEMGMTIVDADDHKIVPHEAFNFREYLTDEEMKNIAERVFERELLECFEEFKKNTYNFQDFFSFQTLYHKIVDQYISKMNYDREDFIPHFNKLIEKGKQAIIDSDGDITYSPLVNAINRKLEDIAKESIENDREQIKSLVRERVLKVCDEVLPLQIIARTVYELNLPNDSRERVLSVLTTEYLNHKESKIVEERGDINGSER